MTSFRVDTDSLKRNSNILYLNASSMKGYSGQLTAVMNSLDSSLSGVKPALSTIITNTSKLSAYLNAHGMALSNIAAAYMTAENDILGNIKGDSFDKDAVAPNEGSSKDGSEAFDSDGKYGGNQMDIEKHTNIFPFKFLWWGKDNDLYDFIRKHPGFENYTDDQIKELLSHITSGGCGWIACTNMIFAEFEGRPEDFEKAFGFPMYDSNGDLNYDQLCIDLYLNTGDKYYIGPDDVNGEQALYNSMYNYYKDNPDEFKNKYGIDMLGPDGKITTDAYNKIIQEKDNLIAASDGKCVTYKNDQPGTNDLERTNRLNHYLSERGIDSYTHEYHETYSNSDIEKALDDGKTVVISVSECNLYDPNGGTQTINGSHAVVVTGVTPEGDYIVSSWGEKYIYKPNEQTQSDGTATTNYYEVYDIFDETK